jgi:hypothetical protein
METRSPIDVTAGAAPVVATGSEYEFDDTHNRVFSELGTAMGFVAIALVVFGALLILGGVAQLFDGAEGLGLAGLVHGTVMLLTGIWTRGAARSVHRIVASRGNDVGNLMHAMEHLGRVYRLQRALLLVAIAFVVLEGVAALIGGH